MALESLPLIGKLLLKAAELWERRERAKQLKQQEQESDAIKKDAKAVHTDRFGASSGRVRVERDSEL
ncbi:hypothetical protein EM55_010075 [Vibrio parahaemolyticus]|nr:hypothetical protein EM55_010075 [Vibrio parahaemolyticus]